MKQRSISVFGFYVVYRYYDRLESGNQNLIKDQSVTPSDYWLAHVGVIDESSKERRDSPNILKVPLTTAGRIGLGRTEFLPFFSCSRLARLLQASQDYLETSFCS